MPWVYILRCSDGTLYVGHTDNIRAREHAHSQRLGPRYTAARLPVRLAYAEEHASAAKAIERERQLKRWSAKKKEALIASDTVTLKQLSKRRRNE